MEGDPDKASKGFEQTLALSKDPRTLAWSHIYLGRLYDTMDPPDRAKAVAEYKAALVTGTACRTPSRRRRAGWPSRSCCPRGTSLRTPTSRSIRRARQRRKRTSRRLRSRGEGGAAGVWFHLRFAGAGGASMHCGRRVE